MQSPQNEPRIRAMAWDPHSPATLQLPTGDTKETFRVDSTLSHDGVGCNAHETSALMELLDARDAFLKPSDDQDAPVNGSSSNGTISNHVISDNVSNESNNCVSLSRAYRRALAKCIQEWDSEMAGNDEGGIPATGTVTATTPREEENLELLKVSYAVTHLSETFLLAPNHDGIIGSGGMDYYEQSSSLPGAVTAETVRYLRLHHMTDPRTVCEDAILEELENSMQPEQLDGGEPYWKLMETFLLRGCLDDACALFNRHSLRRQAEEAVIMGGMDEYQAATLAQDQDGFRAVEALLLSAPLPGGRTDEFDADYLLSHEENNIVHEDLLEGVPPMAYRLWESNVNNRNAGDFPVNFESGAALHVYRSWQQTVKALPEVQNLQRRIPQLQMMLNILTGNFKGIIFESWAEELCAELLYVAPNLRLIDMHVRASKVMQKHGEGETSFFNEVVLSVMKGNAGRVIEVLHELGGGSGAALPAVMTSLLCDLLDDAEVMPVVSSEYSIRNELLIIAAFAIRSSFAIESQNDIGTRLAVRLLLPHIKVDGDIAITANMVNALEHHSPETDAEANTLLDLCRSLVERKNVRVLDGCVSICMARYQHFISDNRPGGAIYWLLVGIEMEMLCFHGPDHKIEDHSTLYSSVCYRKLVMDCSRTAKLLLQGVLGEGSAVSIVFAEAKEMIAACDESDVASLIPEVKMLTYVVTMAEAVAERKDDTLVASSIIACLEDCADESKDGEVSCLAKPSTHFDLLRLAKIILDRNKEREVVEEMHLHAASFDVHGMQVLLVKLTLLVASIEMEGASGPSQETIYQLRLSFAEGLMRAFVAENAMKQASLKNEARVSVAGIYAADLGKVSRDKQELVVQNMLEF